MSNHELHRQVLTKAANLGLGADVNRPGDRYGTRYRFTVNGGARNVSPTLCGAKQAQIWLDGYVEGRTSMIATGRVAEPG